MDMNGNLHELYINRPGGGGWIDNLLPTSASPLLTGLTTTPLTAYTFVARDSDGTITEGSEHIIYMDTNGNLRELFITRPVGTWTDVPLPAVSPFPWYCADHALAAYSFVAFDAIPSGGGDS